MKLRYNYNYLVALFFYLASLALFISSNTGSGAAFSVLGSTFLILGATWQNQQGAKTVELGAEQAGEIRTLLASGQKVNAIKRVRELSGSSLFAAKTYVDTLEKE